VGGFIAIPALRSWTRDVDVGALTPVLAAAEGESTVGLYGYPRSISSLAANALAHEKTRRVKGDGGGDGYRQYLYCPNSHSRLQ
jgi:hypothetical protein